MVQRIISAVVGIILLGFLINMGGWLFFLTISLLNIFAVYELNNAFKKININIAFGQLIIFTLMLLLSAKYISRLNFMIIPLSLFLLIIFIFLYSIINNTQNHITDIVFSIFTFIYTSTLFMYFILMRNLFNGIYYIWWVFITTWACDTGAFFTGILFGKNRLAPNISPHKTVEGSVGGILFSIIASIIYTSLFLPKIPFFDSLIVGFLIGVFSQVGDLSASLIKRYCNIKDFSKIIPGHGGILDRFDSALFTFPVAYFYIIFFIQKGDIL
ncbi:MAG TPA: phosphatidate cytidylyltransferase [Thermoanaerobacterales bacterium]|nr:phosphatidate cytidylyltransferase [Thermoanaerobacterales bacterium]